MHIRLGRVHLRGAMLVLVGLLLGCEPRVRDQAPPDGFIAEDVAVIRAALQRDSATGRWVGSHLADELRTSSEPTDWSNSDTSGVPPDALSDFERRNQAGGSVPSELANALGAPLVDADSQVEASGRAMRWPSIVRVTRPGYSEDGRYAVVATAISCGPLCGSSSIELLVRHGTGWRAVRSLYMMVH